LTPEISSIASKVTSIKIVYQPFQPPGSEGYKEMVVIGGVVSSKRTSCSQLRE